MKNIKYMMMAAVAALTVSSCELERLDYTQISPDNFFKTETDLKLAVNDLYNDFASGAWGGNTVYAADYNGYQVLSDMTSDVLWSCWAWESDELYFHQWNATQGIQGIVWNAFAHYNYLSAARNTIRRIEASPVKESAKILYAAEAKALRGWMALYLYDMFGPVPVASDAILDDPQTFVYLPRATDEEYDAMMEADLRAAIEGLPEVASARGRMTKGAARMILLKYYMIRGKFAEAETLARDLYAMEGIYNLQPDYNYVFSLEGVGNNEIILQIPCNGSAEWLANHMVAETLPSDYPWAEKAEGWGGYVMPWDFYDTFEVGDKRLENIKTEYTTTSGEKKDRTNSNQLKYGALPLKYGVEPGMQGSICSIDVVIYRYSDVLLTLAECINRNNNGPTAEAEALLNRVRARVGLAPVASGMSYEQFNEVMLLERGHEFYYEGLRRQDLIRFGKYVEYANARIDAINASEGRGYFNVTDAHNRFFIPQSFIDESKSEIKQNRGY